MRLVIVTGMSGAGKTIALKVLEDLGFYCVDNLPIPLVEKFSELIGERSENAHQVALGLDIRSGDELSTLNEIMLKWKQQGRTCEILFLDAGDATLIKRYKETRRAHPLAGNSRVDKGIEQERLKLEFLKVKASYIIDTSQLLTKELRQELEKIFLKNESYKNLYTTILSFGFKYGIPSDADLVFDVRFLPNPYYEEQLRVLTGEEQVVRDYVMQGGVGEQFLEKLCDLLKFLIPNYILEGKNQLVIAIGCTGGKHRSVTIAKAVYDSLLSQEGMGIKIEHRDIDNDNKRRK